MTEEMIDPWAATELSLGCVPESEREPASGLVVWLLIFFAGGAGFCAGLLARWP